VNQFKFGMSEINTFLLGLHLI